MNQHDEQDILELSAIAPERRVLPLRWDEDGAAMEEMVELAVPEDFGTIDHAELERDRIRMDSLRLRDNLTDEQRLEVSYLLGKLFRRLVIGGPDHALKLVPEATQQLVVDRFFAPSQARLLAMLEQMDEAAILRLAQLGGFTPGSSGSTEATQNGGEG